MPAYENGQENLIIFTEEMVAKIPEGTTYVLNLNTKKSRIATCSSASEMEPLNKELFCR